MKDYEYKARYPEAWDKGEIAARTGTTAPVCPFPIDSNEAAAFSKGLFWTRQEMRWLEDQERMASAVPAWCLG